MLNKFALAYLYFRTRGYGHDVAEWLIKQSKLEAGPLWDSRAAREDNNVWGMGKVYTRPTTQISAREAQDGSGQNTIAAYRTVLDSHRDRVLFDDWHLRNVPGSKKRKVKRSLPDYLEYMRTTAYNTKPTYYQTVNRVQWSADTLRLLVSVAVVGVTATVLYILWKKRFKK